MNQIDEAAWLQGLKVGDQVAIGRHWNPHWIAKVTSVTPTIIRVDRKEFRRKDGYPRGSDRYGGRIEPVTPEILDRIARSNLINRLGQVKWSTVSTENLRRMVALIPEPEPRPESAP